MKTRSRGFTLLELLVVLGITATLAAITFLILNPVEYLRRARDAQRLKDYALINQAVNFYAYNEAAQSGDADLDGPNYSESCKGEINQRIFVSVPSDDGESSPTPPPAGWVYARATLTSYRNINGSGWLPINFNTTGGGLMGVNVLPVDPINTFDSGFYYTYTCGSYELNVHFESSKYQQLAADDGGDDPDVYELGSDLSTAPYQEVYHAASAGGSSTSTVPTVNLYASPSTVNSGNSTTLSWTTSNANTCTASGGWSGAKAVSGYVDVVPPADTTYALTCTGSGGVATSSLLVTVTVSSPQTITLAPSVIGSYHQWILTGSSEVGASGALNDASTFSFIATNVLNNTNTYFMGSFTTSTPGSGTINSVTWKVTARDTDAGAIWQIRPYFRFLNGKTSLDTASSSWPVFNLGLTNNDGVFRNYQQTYTSNPCATYTTSCVSGPWTWVDIANLEVGARLSYSGAAAAQISEMSIDVNYSP